MSEERSCFSCPFDDCVAESDETCVYLLKGIRPKTKEEKRQDALDKAAKQRERYKNDPEYRAHIRELAKEVYARKKAKEAAQNY